MLLLMVGQIRLMTINNHKFIHFKINVSHKIIIPNVLLLCIIVMLYKVWLQLSNIYKKLLYVELDICVISS